MVSYFALRYRVAKQSANAFDNTKRTTDGRPFCTYGLEEFSNAKHFFTLRSRISPRQRFHPPQVDFTNSARNLFHCGKPAACRHPVSNSNSPSISAVMRVFMLFTLLFLIILMIPPTAKDSLKFGQSRKKRKKDLTFFAFCGKIVLKTTFRRKPDACKTKKSGAATRIGILGCQKIP